MFTLSNVVPCYGIRCKQRLEEVNPRLAQWRQKGDDCTCRNYKEGKAGHVCYCSEEFPLKGVHKGSTKVGRFTKLLTA